MDNILTSNVMVPFTVGSYLQCLNGKCTAIQGPGYMRPSENLGFLIFSYVYLSAINLVVSSGLSGLHFVQVKRVSSAL